MSNLQGSPRQERRVEQLDFIHYSSLQTHTTTTLAALSSSLETFHSVKDIFIDLGARDAPHFNIPKIHSMIHYVDLIRRFGSADGFNTETPEWLHINYAKDAYRASNCKDYIVQMTRWQGRQEAVDNFTAVLEWQRNPDAYLPVPVILNTDQNILELSGSSPSTVRLPISAMKRAAIFSNLQPPPSNPHYHIASIHKSSHKNIKICTIAADLHASRFLNAIQSYLASKNCSLIPSSRDLFDLFKQITFTLPKTAFCSPPRSPNTIHVSLSSPAAGRKPAEPSRSGFALIKTDKPNPHTTNTPLEGTYRSCKAPYRHVRVLFSLPERYGVPISTPLAYVEWLTPFRRPDPQSGIYKVSHSTQMGALHAEIIPIERLRGPLSDVKNTPPKKLLHWSLRQKPLPKTTGWISTGPRKTAQAVAHTFSKYYEDGGSLNSQTDSQSFVDKLYAEAGEEMVRRDKTAIPELAAPKLEDGDENGPLWLATSSGWKIKEDQTSPAHHKRRNLKLQTKLSNAKQEIESLKTQLQSLHKKLHQMDNEVVAAERAKDSAEADAWIATSLHKLATSEAQKQ
ncbi:hypothetical protein AAF712_015870 [Marasmius tenuissimus]|uniref:Uncharacterized protein n=1 Tax=Marasmius tenuissimus TaxID=585030 RepID=A0ABR2Z742_9AGAR